MTDDGQMAIRSAVAVALEARALCHGDATPELEAALKERAIEIQRQKGAIRPVPLAAELLAWLNGTGERGGQRKRRLRTPSNSVAPHGRTRKPQRARPSLY